VFLGGQLDTGGAAVVSALRDQLGDRVAILVPDAFPPSLLIEQAGSAASGVFVSLTGIAGARTHPLFPGAVVDRVLQVPVGLLR
jgi:hypothetical protein